ncbi:sigma-70 family RNA polymerase sigma factor [Marinilabiliaceae bacterium JC017]|nr:sigma-70 family RNA polymerase sigma factor [Marinilabiliaceae bacterium JC017]
MNSQPVVLDPDSWVRKYGDILYTYAISRVNDPNRAEDLVQETFLAGLKNMAGFKGHSSEQTWLIAILKRKVVDFYRQKARNREVKLETNPQRFKKDKPMKGHWLDTFTPKRWDNEAQIKLESDEFMHILKRCIEKLPIKWASCFMLRIMEEMKTEEICKELNITSSNLWVILHRARLQLRDCLESNWIKE